MNSLAQIFQKPQVRLSLWRNRNQRFFVLIFILVAITLGLAARLAYLGTPPRVVSDERHYVRDGIAYADFIQNRDWSGLVTYRGHFEHPPLIRILWGAAIAAARGLGLPTPELIVARWTSVIFGLALVVLTTLVNPFAGLFLAVQSVEAMFTTRAYLEALPALTSAAAVFSYVQYRKHKRVRWLYLTAVALGIVAASKYIYLTAGIALAPFLIWDHRREPLRLVAFGAIVMATFVLFNPHMWVNPIRNIRESIQYHLNFQGKARVARFGRQWWYPIAYAAAGHGPVLPDWGLSFNFVIFVLGVLGLPHLFKVNRIYFVWFGCSLFFLMIWQTKWNQYVLTFLTPLCLSAGYFVSASLIWANARLSAWHYPARVESTRES